MARPITPTPILEKEDKRSFLKELEELKHSPEKEEFLKKCDNVFAEMKKDYYDIKAKKCPAEICLICDSTENIHHHYTSPYHKDILLMFVEIVMGLVPLRKNILSRGKRDEKKDSYS